jgi:serine/threonine-protein kinase
MVPESDRLDKVKEILENALELPADKRDAFVLRACGDDEAVRAEVESLLAHESDQPLWAEGPLLQVPGAPEEESGEEGVAPGQRIGPYRVEAVIGTGGMGTVVLAIREDDFSKKVALKVVHARLSNELIRRFHSERQIVAQLEHPNIARLLDGGTADDGRPYLVLELVDGEPIDVYCDRMRLGVRERIELVLSVCGALAFAHRNLVVHRDIKPSNILVTDDGVPKLLDFGIAKRLDLEATELTRLHDRPMTLRYASPEQIDGKAISTATDVHGIGLLLYQLLAGQRPFAMEEDSEARLREAIRERMPRRPSSTAEDPRRRRELEGDLDAIVGKALRKEPEERYGSIEQLADDLRRYLEGRPVLARQGTWLYVAGRFVRRHRWALGAVALVLLLSLAFGLTATLLWRRAETARQETEIARVQALEGQQQKERALEFLKEVFRGAGPNRARGERDRTALELLEDVEARLPKEDERVQAELLATLGQIYADWGLSEDAGRVWTRAERLLRRRYPQGHPELAKAINNVASWHLRREEYAEAARLYREALAMKQRFPASEDIDVAKAMSNLATALMELGDDAEVERLYRSALAIRRSQIPPNWDDIAQNLRNLGVFYHERGDLKQAEALMREALVTCQRAHPGQENTRYATILNGLARVLQDEKRPTEALPLFGRALEIRKTLLGDSHLHVAASWLDLAAVELDLGNRQEGRPFLDQARAWLARQEPDLYGRYRAAADGLLGAYLLAEGRSAEAEPYLMESHRWLTRNRPESDPDRRRTDRWLADLARRRAVGRERTTAN